VVRLVWEEAANSGRAAHAPLHDPRLAGEIFLALRRRIWGMDPNRNEDLEQWFAEFSRLNAELRPFIDRLGKKRGDRGEWTEEPTRVEGAFDELRYLYNAALVNNGAVFTYMHFMIPRKWQFEAIGARGCIAAMDALMTFYNEQQKLETDEEKMDYWHQTRSDRDPAEDLAEDPNVFARLLLDFARRELEK